jgi:hypothetical protein
MLYKSCAFGPTKYVGAESANLLTDSHRSSLTFYMQDRVRCSPSAVDPIHHLSCGNFSAFVVRATETGTK